MGIFKSLFGKKETSSKPSPEEKIEVTASGNTIKIGDIGSITFGSPVVGQSTGSSETDFYVYEWYIKETGEVFYVGKGRGDRYKEYHERAYEAEKIRERFETDVRFVAKDLTEEQALELETNEMTRILNETNYCLANRITPYFTKRESGYCKSSSTPSLQFETAPILYAEEVDEHYFGIQGRPFDAVEYQNLSNVVFIDKGVSKEEIDIVYGGDYRKYYNETVALLEANGNKIMKSRYAKSITAWIYPCEDLVTNNDIAEQSAMDKIGRRIPSYHLIDVWKLLKTEYGDVDIPEEQPVEIHPINTRCPLSQIKNLHDWDAGFDAGFKYWEKGDAERKAGNIEKAIELFDKARYNGYFAPALYTSYAMAYRKLKDLDNEIAILDEAIERYQGEERDSSQNIIDCEKQKAKAIEKLKKQRK